MDGQGAARVRPYVESAAATYTTLIDERAATGQLYGFKSVGNGFLIDDEGTLEYTGIGGFDIRRPRFAERMERWAAEGIVPDHTRPVGVSGPASSRADALYGEGLALFNEGKREEAVSRWREALTHEPDSIIIHRHMWAVENPERFYDGEIDQEWKRRQTELGL